MIQRRYYDIRFNMFTNNRQQIVTLCTQKQHLLKEQNVSEKKIKRFSLASKSNWFSISTLKNWHEKLPPCFHPIRMKSENNHHSLTSVFPRVTSAACYYCEISSLVQWVFYVLCDWLESFLLVWFYDTIEIYSIKITLTSSRRRFVPSPNSPLSLLLDSPQFPSFSSSPLTSLFAISQTPVRLP